MKKNQISITPFLYSVLVILCFWNVAFASEGRNSVQLNNVGNGACMAWIDGAINAWDNWGFTMNNTSFYYDGNWFTIEKKSNEPFVYGFEGEISIYRKDPNGWTEIFTFYDMDVRLVSIPVLDNDKAKLSLFLGTWSVPKYDLKLIEFNYDSENKLWIPQANAFKKSKIHGFINPPKIIRYWDSQIYNVWEINKDYLNLSVSNNNGESWERLAIVDTSYLYYNAGFNKYGQNKELLFWIIDSDSTHKTIFIPNVDSINPEIENNMLSSFGIDDKAYTANLKIDIKANAINDFYVLTRMEYHASENGVEDLVLFKRKENGEWSYFPVQNNVEFSYVLPQLVIDDTNERVYFFWSDSQSVKYKVCKWGEENTLINQSPIIAFNEELNGINFNNITNFGVPKEGVNDDSDLMIIVNPYTYGNPADSLYLPCISVQLPIGPNYPECATSLDTLIRNFTISKENSNIKLTWNDIAAADSFVVYRSSEPYFETANSRLGMTIDTSFSDFNILGDAAVNHFYRVQAFMGGVGGPVSDAVGEFEIELKSPEGKTHLNFISMPVEDSSVKMASDLANKIVGGVEVIYKWDANAQGWIAYLPVLPPTDYAVQSNVPYLISTYSPGIVSFVGNVSEEVSYNLVTTSGTNLNTLSIPFEQEPNVSSASDLVGQIGTVEVVYKWDANVQGWIAYLPALPPTDYSIFPGMGLLLNVTADSIWP